ncbi:potassium transporter TrkG [Desemzia incerta]|uniref:TrkH family potassium uptake protein n=1 Tax=Desemzia incerta TaxID=82801 RepID=UPI0024C25EED|nr:potassium transporter TrkG [Desemzia incerta]WHZ32263.1 potassium transporter TrkG [Desemzia incerta]
MIRDKFRLLSPSTKIAVSFLVIIFIGSLLLSMPISHLPDSNVSYFENLFTSVSMVCVTGLLTTPIVTTYSLFGKIVCILLMQVGGLGLMTILAAFIVGVGRRMTFRDTIAVNEALNRHKIGDFKDYLTSIIKYTAIIEGSAFVLLALRFVPDFGVKKGLFHALFLAVSGFSNAGFDSFEGDSLQNYVHDPLVNGVMMGLIILGGIGFSVWFDVTENVHSIFKKRVKIGFMKDYKRLQVHTRLALNISLFLLILGTVVFLVLEWNNPESIGAFNVGDKVLAALFQSTTFRTAGFTTIDFLNFNHLTLFLLTITSFIGGSPGGTAGGLKTTTVALVVLLMYNEVKGQRYVNYAYHTIPTETVRRALVIVITFFVCFMLGTSLLLYFEQDQQPFSLMFETASALTTIGLTIDLTPKLSAASQIVIMILMFIGRIGPITIFLSLGRSSKKHRNHKYAKTNILIG